MNWLSKDNKLQIFDRALNGGLFVATAVLLTAGYFLTFRPLDVECQEIRQEVADLHALVARMPEITKKHQGLHETLAAHRKQTSEIWLRIPASPRESDYLAQVAELAGRTGMHIGDYRPGLIEQRESHHELEVKLVARGEYKALCQFMEQVDQIPRLSRMTHMEIATQPTDLLSVELTYRIYFAPPAVGPVADKR